MAEHNGGNRGGNRGDFGGNRGDRGSFRANNNSGGDPRGFRSRDKRDGNDQGRSFGDRDRRSFGDRGDRGERPARDGERRQFGDRNRDRKPFNEGRGPRNFDRPRRDGDDRRSFGPRRDDDRRSFGDRGDRGERPARDGERRQFGDRDRDRKPFNEGRGPRNFDRPRRDGDDRRSFGPRRDDDRRSFGDRGDRGERPARDGERRQFGDRDRDRKPFNEGRGPRNFDRPRRDGDDRRSFGDRKPFRDRPRDEERGRDDERFSRGGDRRSFAGRGEGPEGQEERPARIHNAKDIRSSNRPDRERSPEIDEDVTGRELDRATMHQVKTLEDQSAGWVSKHLVMAGRLVDVEPELAFQHALAASRRGGRLSAVREAVGLTAYAAGHYGEALREFRTYRRISGSNVHLPIMADCERGLGRPDRALDMVRSPEAQDLDAPGKVELAIVASGARSDLNQVEAAVAELEIPQLDINRAFSYSPRLFRAYAEALIAAGRADEAVKWERQAVVAENALGIGEFEEPEIVDLGWDEEEEEAQRKPRFNKDSGDAVVEQPDSETVIAEAAAADVEHDDANIDDAESDYFESDDPESDVDSAEDEDKDEDAEEAEDTDSRHG